MSSDTDQPSGKRLPPALVAGLVAAIVLDTLLQVLWKEAALSLLATLSPAAVIGVILRQPLFLIVGLLFAAQMVNWLKVLAKADVSFALPITALSYVSVAAVSALILHEAITWPRMAGIALILGGVVLVSRSSYDTRMDDVA